MDPNSDKIIRFGVLADTHIPDRIKQLPEGILDAFREARVQRILHAGDASCWRVIEELEKVAPVHIVQGNRDWFFGMRTPKSFFLTVHGRRIALTHGHRTMVNYLFDKWAYITKGYYFERYYQHLSNDYPDADVVIFGHTHHQTARWIKDRLFFNPGPAYPCTHNHFKPQYGLLSITPKGELRTECHRLG